MAGREFRVVVAGAGVSGLFMAETLRRARIDFTVYEKAGEVGATWRDNTFPGPAVPRLRPPSPRQKNSSPDSVPPFPIPFGWAAARTGTPAISARRSCGRCRRASTRRSSTKYRWKISVHPYRAKTELSSRPSRAAISNAVFRDFGAAEKS
jgi:cation diffusion facilitator CzcD-associated flavoprotein CzcO